MGSRLNFNVRFRNIHNWSQVIKLRIKSFDSIQIGVRIVLGFIGKEISPIVGQRVSRTYRNIQLHSKLWSHYLPKSSINHRRWTLGLLLSTLCKPKFDVIEDKDLLAHKTDIDYIHQLVKATITCPKCKERLVVSKKIPGIKYCLCPDADIVDIVKKSGYPWAPFVETGDLLIWRKPHPDYDGLYIYKVYGYYDDVTAEDFLTTQLDLDYRKTWDNSVLQLRIVDRDTKTKSEIVYWEMKWPRMFSNRDYCFVRRHLVDRDTKTIVIMSKLSMHNSTFLEKDTFPKSITTQLGHLDHKQNLLLIAVTHPEVSEVKGTVRVSEYWSVMQIRPAKGMNECGVEFGLTYFDNPGLSLPNWLTTWASLAGIPDFLSNVRHAARLKSEGRNYKLRVGINEIKPAPNTTTSTTIPKPTNTTATHPPINTVSNSSRPSPSPATTTYTDQTPTNNQQYIS